MKLTRRLILAAGMLAAILAWPNGLPAATTDLYFSSTYVFASPAFSVKRFDGITGKPVGTVGTFATSDGLSFPRGLAFGPDRNLYVASEGTNNILKYDGSSGVFLGEFVPAGAGGSPGVDGLMSPKGIAFGPDGNLYVASNGSPNALLKFNGATGAFLADLVPTAPMSFLGTPIWGLTFGPDGNLYVSSGAAGNVLRFNPISATFVDEFVTLSSGGLANPRGLTFGPDGNLYVTGGDTAGRVWEFNGTTGGFVGLFVSTLDNGGLSRPDGIAFGPDGSLYVSSGDTLNVLQYSGSDGHFLDVFAALDFPLGLSPAGLVFYPAVPEPETLTLAVAGGTLLITVAWRRARPTLFSSVGRA